MRAEISDQEIIKNEVVITEENNNALNSIDNDISINRLAVLLRQKQKDQQEIRELRYKLDREIKLNDSLTF